MKGKLNGRYIKDTNDGGGYSLCDTVARANKGYATANGSMSSSVTSNICPITITPKIDGYILVMVITDPTWGYDGKNAILTTTCLNSSLSRINWVNGGTEEGGNNIGRQMFSISLWGPCTAGQSYTFKSDLGAVSVGRTTPVTAFAFVI